MLAQPTLKLDVISIMSELFHHQEPLLQLVFAHGILPPVPAEIKVVQIWSEPITLLAQLNFQHAHLMELIVSPRLLAQLMPKLDVLQESELELMEFASGIQLPLHQHAEQWFVEMLPVELVLLFVQSDFQDVFQMELNVLPKLHALHIPLRLHAIQVELMEFVSSLLQPPQELLLDQEHAKQ